MVRFSLPALCRTVVVCLLLSACGGGDDSAAPPGAGGSGAPIPAPAPVPPPDPPQGTGSATLSWTPPTQRVDGSPLGTLAGYRFLYSLTSGQYDHKIRVDNPGIMRYVIEGLTPGTWYFSITAIDTDGLESSPSKEASKTIPD